MRRTGPWSPEQIQSHLERCVVPLRLGCHSRSGWPVVLSLWYVMREGALWCATSSRARVAAMLESDPRCAFEVASDEPPYRGVRGQGRAALDRERGGEILAILIDRYLRTRSSPMARWLLSRSASELAIRIEPTRLTSWDYSARMGAK